MHNIMYSKFIVIEISVEKIKHLLNYVKILMSLSNDLIGLIKNLQ